MKRIQDGDTEAVLELWIRVKRFVNMKAFERSRFSYKCPGEDYDVLMQEGFLAMLDTVKCFDVSKPYTFITCLGYKLLNRFQDATGWLRRPGRHDPTKVLVASLDAPAGEDDDATLGDFIVDENAEGPADTAESRLLRRTVLEAVETLPPEQQEAIIGHFYHGLPLDVVDKKQYSKALQALRKPTISAKLMDFL